MFIARNQTSFLLDYSKKSQSRNIVIKSSLD